MPAMPLVDAIMIVVSSILGTLGSALIIMNFLKASREFNPFIKINEKLKKHDEILEEHNERITANRKSAFKANEDLKIHQDAFSEAQYVTLKSIKALLDHEIKPNKANVEKASQELEDYLIKK